MKELFLSAKVRTRCGGGYRRQLAARGRIPAVIYGKEVRNLLLELSVPELEKILRDKASRSRLINLQIEGEGWKQEKKAIIKEIQHDPITGKLRHVDFHQVSLEEEVTVEVPLEFTGEPVGLKKGGVIQHMLDTVEISCLPVHIPEMIVVDISGLDIGDALFIRDISFPANVEVLSDPDTEVIAVLEGIRRRTAEAEEEEPA